MHANEASRRFNPQPSGLEARRQALLLYLLRQKSHNMVTTKMRVGKVKRDLT